MRNCTSPRLAAYTCRASSKVQKVQPSYSPSLCAMTALAPAFYQVMDVFKMGLGLRCFTPRPPPRPELAGARSRTEVGRSRPLCWVKGVCAWAAAALVAGRQAQVQGRRERPVRAKGFEAVGGGMSSVLSPFRNGWKTPRPMRRLEPSFFGHQWLRMHRPRWCCLEAGALSHALQPCFAGFRLVSEVRRLWASLMEGSAMALPCASSERQEAGLRQGRAAEPFWRAVERRRCARARRHQGALPLDAAEGLHRSGLLLLSSLFYSFAEGLEDVQLLLGGGVALRRKCRGPLKPGQETPASHVFSISFSMNLPNSSSNISIYHDIYCNNIYYLLSNF